jgi:hypothetical protein
VNSSFTRAKQEKTLKNTHREEEKKKQAEGNKRTCNLNFKKENVIS